MTTGADGSTDLSEDTQPGADQITDGALAAPESSSGSDAASPTVESLTKALAESEAKRDKFEKDLGAITRGRAAQAERDNDLISRFESRQDATDAQIGALIRAYAADPSAPEGLAEEAQTLQQESRTSRAQASFARQYSELWAALPTEGIDLTGDAQYGQFRTDWEQARSSGDLAALGILVSRAVQLQAEATRTASVNGTGNTTAKPRIDLNMTGSGAAGESDQQWLDRWGAGADGGIAASATNAKRAKELGDKGLVARPLQ